VHSVMVVDDEPFVRLSIASLADWEEEGYDFGFEAANGEEALAQLSLHPEISIVLLDLSMPVMDGLEFLRRLRGRGAAAEGKESLPAVLVLSAHDDFHLVREAFKLGALDYLLKSELEAEALRRALAKAAGTLAESRERTVAILERRQLESLKAQVLRDLLSSPPPEDLVASFPFLGIELAPPFALVPVWIEDFETVEERWRDEGLARFSDMLYRSLSQLLSERYRGEVVLLRPSHAVVFVAAPGAAHDAERQAAAYGEDAREYLERYLSVRCSLAASTACAGPGEAAEAYGKCRLSRSVESRIVVLAKRAIRERYADPAFSLDEAGLRAGVSPNHLSFEFSRETGETFSSFLSRTRMDEAKRLLASTDLLVYEVGERVGYPSAEHFARTFKRIVGVSPGRYKLSGGGEGQAEG
jgi:two-component system, response regulator YesN